MAIPVRVGLRRVDGLDLMVDDRGSEDWPAIVIAVGFGEQLGSAEFPDEFADALCARNWRVIRFDHRDIGLSTGFDDQPVDLDDVVSRVRSGQAVQAPYTLVDMADDVAGIIRGLGVAVPVRVVGVSMGGFIARWTAVRYPDLVDSLVLVMTTFDSRPTEGMPAADPAVVQKMLAKAVRKIEPKRSRPPSMPGGPTPERRSRSTRAGLASASPSLTTAPTDPKRSPVNWRPCSPHRRSHRTTAASPR